MHNAAEEEYRATLGWALLCRLDSNLNIFVVQASHSGEQFDLSYLV